MKLTYYDVILKRISESDKELIRYWRNHDKIRNKMEFREYITPEMHNEWYNKISNYRNAFGFIVYYHGTASGVVYNVNHSQQFSEGGMFLWEDKYIGTQIPVLVSIMLTDLNFYFMRQERAYISILKDNINSQQFNKWFGYELVEEKDNSYNQRYILTEENYRQQSIKIKAMLSSYYSRTSLIKIILEKEDLNSGLYDFLKPFIQLMNSKYELFDVAFE